MSGAGSVIFRLVFSLGSYLLVEGTDCGTVPEPRIYKPVFRSKV